LGLSGVVAFDADQYIEALRPPSFKFRGRTYVGRVLSADEWILLQARRDREEVGRAAARKKAANAKNDKTKDGFSEATVERIVRETIGAARKFARACIVSWFPAPWWIRPFAWLLPDVFHPAWRAFRELPDSAQVEAVKDFSESQRKAMPTSQPPGTERSETRDRRSDT
jgi:hypothetical protein